MTAFAYDAAAGGAGEGADDDTRSLGGGPDVDRPGYNDGLETDLESAAVDYPERELSSTIALFEGDEGGLELAQRRVLVALLKQRFISAQTHPKDWAALVANPRPIRGRLNDLFMELHLDREREVAYKRQVVPEGGGRPFPTLLYDAPWGREETILLVYLRTRHRSEQAGGVDRAFVDKADMLEFIAQHRPERATDLAGDAKKALRAVEAIYKTGLLTGPSTADRFEISNAIEVLLPMEKLRELLGWLRQQNSALADRSGANGPQPEGQAVQAVGDDFTVAEVFETAADDPESEI